MKIFIQLLLGSMLGAVFSLQAAEQNFNVQLDNGVEIPVKKYPGSGKTLFLWLPAEWGLRDQTNQTAERLSAMGHSVWIADLHAAYFEPVGRSSLENMPVTDVVGLLGAATHAAETVYVISAGRGAALSLLAIREWQKKKAGLAGIGGAVFLYPNLSEGAPSPGEEPRFTSVSTVSNLPIYIFQPELAARFWQLDKLREILGAGGSRVYSYVLKEVSDGFDLRAERNPVEKKTAEKLPELLNRAIKTLAFHAEENFPPVKSEIQVGALEAGQLSAGLQVYRGKQRQFELKLPTVEGHSVDIRDYRGQVVLLNFWATWCPPCVKELPSLNRLQKKMEGLPFKVVGIDVAESKAVVATFLQNVKVDFPVLLDTEGVTVAEWQLLAFPMSFLLGPDGEIKYGYYGALEWDTDEVVGVVKSLMPH